MLFVVRFTDRSDKFDVRQAHMQAHLDWLDDNSDQVLIGGGLRESLDDRAIGGLWIAQSESKADVVSLLETDPFWIEGLRENVEILHWTKAFEDRQVQI